MIDEWLLWKRVGEVVRLAVVADVARAAGQPEPELSVLVHLHEAGGMMRQNALSVSTGRDRTRLAHLVDRMEARGLLLRNRITNGVEVHLSHEGRAVVGSARPLLEDAVRRHLLDRLDTSDRNFLHAILLKLQGGRAEDVAPSPRRTQRSTRN